MKMKALKTAHRGHVVDDVFGQLSVAILRGELAPGAALPAERILGQRFDVSALIVRQAVHMLADHGLVRVRQGGATIVCDPDQSTDPRVTALLYQSAPEVSPRLCADMIEKQCMQGLALVEIAARRGTREKLETVVALVEETANDRARLARFSEFEERFWIAVADAADNRIFQKEIAWWQRVMSARQLPVVDPRPPKQRIAVHRELARRMLDADDAVGYYLRVIRPLVDAQQPSRRGRRR
jgi:DNA-binding FadR family transcriptional regulator